MHSHNKISAAWCYCHTVVRKEEEETDKGNKTYDKCIKVTSLDKSVKSSQDDV